MFVAKITKHKKINKPRLIPLWKLAPKTANGLLLFFKLNIKNAEFRIYSVINFE